ncbi:MAG: flippase-like domain-containing protein [Deltaproteobacteria bacterium]|jgi:uncharacterized membrane protein YbhN (UPF0104 family)|nr:flippase-like domain-containing protein [Deltaproteobacteria bacterium]
MTDQKKTTGTSGTAGTDVGDDDDDAGVGNDDDGVGGNDVGGGDGGGGNESGPNAGGEAGGGGKKSSPLMLAASLALTALCVLAIVWFVRANFAEFREVWGRPIPKAVLVALPLAWLLMVAANSELLRLAVTAFDLRLTFLEGLALTAVTTAVNYVVPLKGGSGVRGLYLASVRRLTVTNYLAQLVSVSVMTLTTASLFGLFGLVVLWVRGHSPHPLLPAYFAATALGGAASVLFLGRLPVRLPPRLAALAQGWDSLRSTPGLWRRLGVLQVCYFFAWALVNWLSLAALQVRLDPPGVFFYCAGQIHATLVNLTPAGLGFVEAFSAYAGRVLEFTPAQALSAQALSRATAVGMLLVLGAWGWFYLARLTRRRGLGTMRPRL